MNEQTYVIGHKKPDTDSVTAAITLSYLKNKLGCKTVPAVLGNINVETKFVLNYFKVDEPSYLNDVKLQIKDIEYNKENYIYATDTINDAYNYMMDKKISNVPVVDKNHKLLGLVSMKDIAKEFVNGDTVKLKTTYNKLLETLEGEEVLRFDENLEGNIMVAAVRSTTFIQTAKIDDETVLVVGDRHSIIEHAINNKAKLIILTGDSSIKENHIKLAKENHINIIRTNYLTFKASQLINLCNQVETIYLKDGVVSLDENGTVSEFVEIANKTKYSNFPVINKDNTCLGMVKLSDVGNKHKKNVILVDHNEYEQSVDGLDEAEIVEIVDHHKIGSIGTSSPINFRNMPVGSTNTIISILYKENNIEIPKEMAGLMLSGLISDTLLLTSPTTTDLDRKVIEELSNIAGVDYKEYGIEMLKAGTSLQGKSKEEIVFGDFKNFNIDNHKIGISQVSTFNVDEFKNEIDEYIELLNKQAEINDYYILGLFITDILDSSSYAYFNDKALKNIDNCFIEGKAEQGMYLPGVVSRKKQIIPKIMNHLEK